LTYFSGIGESIPLPLILFLRVAMTKNQILKTAGIVLNLVAGVAFAGQQLLAVFPAGRFHAWLAALVIGMNYALHQAHDVEQAAGVEFRPLGE